MFFQKKSRYFRINGAPYRSSLKNQPFCWNSIFRLEQKNSIIFWPKISFQTFIPEHLQKARVQNIFSEIKSVLSYERSTVQDILAKLAVLLEFDFLIRTKKQYYFTAKNFVSNFYSGTLTKGPCTKYFFRNKVGTFVSMEHRIGHL